MQGPKKCELAVETIENKVAFGLLFDDENMNKSIHGVALQPGCARVSVDGAIQGDALIPIPIKGEIETVDQAVGSYVSWPRDLIILPNAPVVEVCMIIGSLYLQKNRRKISGLSYIEIICFIYAEKKEKRKRT